MGSESTPSFEVSAPKSRKRTKKKDRSKGGQENDEKNSENSSDPSTMSKKQKGRKKLNKSLDTDVKLSKLNEEQNIEGDQNDGDSNSEAVPRKKLKTSTAQSISDTPEIEGNKEGSKPSKQPSKRQIKREKAEKRENEKKEASRQEATQRALNYVSKWKHARSEWKFEKMRQVWLMDNLLDKNSIPDNIFPTVLEYFEGCKGMAREQLLKKGMDVIRKAEEDEENRDSIMESVAYKRARQLLQALPTET